LFGANNPFFFSEAVNAFTVCSNECNLSEIKNLSNRLSSLGTDLLIPSNDMKSLFKSSLKQTVEKLIESIISYIRYQNTKAGLDEIEKLFILKKNSEIMLTFNELFNKNDIESVFEDQSYYDIGQKILMRAM